MDVVDRPRSISPIRIAQSRPSRSAAAGGCALAGAALVVTMWWRAAAPPVGAGASLIDAGRLAGLLAGYVAVLQVLLRARLGGFERGLGTDAINAAHRTLGAYLVALVLGHLVLITVGYARAGRASLLDEVISLYRDYPYVLWAMIGAGLLVVVGISSTPAIRRRMRYEVWHGVHLLVYVALALAFFHQTANGEDLRHTAWARYAWTGLWVAAAVLVLWNRWIRPVLLAVRHRLVVATVRPETADTVTVEITGRRLGLFPGEAGQYFRWRFLTAGRLLEAHPYSLSAEPDARQLRLTATGPFAQSLLDLVPGTRVVAEGPCGGLLAPDLWRGPIVLIAGGVGVTPLRALFGICYGEDLTLIYRGHSLDRMPLREELDAIAARRGARVHYLVGSRDDPGNQLTAARLETICPDIRRSLVFVCGSGSFVRHVRAALTDLGVPDQRIRAESFELG